MLRYFLHMLPATEQPLLSISLATRWLLKEIWTVSQRSIHQGWHQDCTAALVYSIQAVEGRL
jgi:hypothetical protein